MLLLCRFQCFDKSATSFALNAKGFYTFCVCVDLGGLSAAAWGVILAGSVLVSLVDEKSSGV